MRRSPDQCHTCKEQNVAAYVHNPSGEEAEIGHWVRIILVESVNPRFSMCDDLCPICRPPMKDSKWLSSDLQVPLHDNKKKNIKSIGLSKHTSNSGLCMREHTHTHTAPPMHCHPHYSEILT